MTTRREAAAPRLHAITDAGRCRHSNQDDFHLSSDGRLWIVADGMGGAVAGEIACALAIAAIGRVMEAPADGRPASARLRTAFDAAQMLVRDYVEHDSRCAGMGTAVLAVWLEADVAHVCHAGDIRCYRRSGNAVELITRDHVGARGLTQAIGVAGPLTPDLTSVPLRRGDRLLVCSDGLWKIVGDERIAARLAEPKPVRVATTTLLDDANAGGGYDNITVVLYQH